MNTVSSSANKPSKDTETSVKVPSKASTISYVDKSTEKSVPVTVSSETNTMVESSISSAVRTGSGSSSFGSSMINKPTANTATTQNTTVINNNHSTNQGGVAVVGNNNHNGNAQGGQPQVTQGNKSGNGHDEGLPQTGEAAATAAVGLGIALIAISGIVVLEKKN